MSRVWEARKSLSSFLFYKLAQKSDLNVLRSLLWQFLVKEKKDDLCEQLMSNIWNWFFKIFPTFADDLFGKTVKNNEVVSIFTPKVFLDFFFCYSISFSILACLFVLFDLFLAKCFEYEFWWERIHVGGWIRSLGGNIKNSR